MAAARTEGLPWAYRVAALLVRPWLMVLTKRDWRGAEHLPREGGFVVSPNHISYADPLPFAHYMFDNGRAAYFLAKESVFRVRGAGWVLRKAGQIPVHRNSVAAADAFRSAVDGVRAGKVVAIFPEGTITRDPDLWPMRGKTGAARVALETRCPLIPVAQWGAQDILSPYGRPPVDLPPQDDPGARRPARRPRRPLRSTDRHDGAARGDRPADGPHRRAARAGARGDPAQ